MKNSLAKILATIPPPSDPHVDVKVEAVSGAFGGFVESFR